MLAWWEVALRLLIALVIGGLIGWDREIRGKPAGFRTLMLVSLASAIYVLTAQSAALQAGETLDPVRAMSGIAQGVGFLGAGAIMQSRQGVKWLTTAAALWASAAVGFGAGLGMYYITALGGFLVLVTLRYLSPVERYLLVRYGRTRQGPPDQED
jgi:putative Mg2+ transporter-C (MgtC) family protein